MKQKRYIAYARVSNKDHDTSLPAQKSVFEKYAESESILLKKIYFEEESAFGYKKRKVFDKIIELLKSDEIDGILFHKVDRSARNMKDFALLESFFDFKDIRVIDGEFDVRSANGRLMFRLFCSMAVYYSENLSEEVTLKMTERLKSGYYPSNPPYGYRKGIKGQDEDWKKKYPDERAETVKELYKRYSTDAYTYTTVIDSLKKEGIKLTKGQVERILTNPYYYGTIKWTRAKTGKVLYFQGNHKPLIEKRLYDKVEKIREHRSIEKGNIGRSYVSRLFVCKCGKHLYVESPYNRYGTKYHYLRCHNKQCDFSSISITKLDEYISGDLARIELKPFAKKVILDAHDKYLENLRKETAKKNPDFNKELSKLKQRRTRIQNGAEMGVYSNKEAMKRLEEINIEEKKVEKLILEHGDKSSIIHNRVKEMLHPMKTLSKRYIKANPIKKREILLRCYRSFRVIDNTILLEPNPILKVIALIQENHNGRDKGTISESFQKKLISIIHEELDA